MENIIYLNTYDGRNSLSKAEFPIDDFTRFGVNGQPAVEAALENLAVEVLQSFVPNGHCLIQDWDGCLECYANLADGSYIGEAIPLVTLTSARIRETGERFQSRLQGEKIELRNETFPPIPILPGVKLDPAALDLLRPLLEARNIPMKDTPHDE